MTRGLKLAVVGLALLSLGLAILAAALSAQNRDTEGRTADVRRTAGAIGTAMLTYDYKHLDAYKTRVVRLSTGEFAQQFRDTFAEFEELYTVTEGSSKVREVSVFVGDVSDDDASAIVQVDYLVSGVGGKNRPQTAFFEVTLVNTVKGWLVANLSTVEPNPGRNSSETSTPAG